MHSQSMTFCRRRSAVSLLGEGREIAAQEVSVVLLQTESAEKWFIATYVNVYRKNQYPLNCMLNLEFIAARQPFILALCF